MRALPLSPGTGPAAYIANKEGVAGEEGNGGLSPGRIGGTITDMFGRMPGSLNDREPDIPELDLIPFSGRRMGYVQFAARGAKISAPVASARSMWPEIKSACRCAQGCG
jgi:hypothetical protein